MIGGDHKFVEVNGNIGIEKTSPESKLDVNGDLIVREKISIPEFQTVLSDTSIDLGEQLQTLVSKYQNLYVRLPDDTIWNWDKVISIPDEHSLSIAGPATINMSEKHTSINPHQDKVFTWRDPARVVVGSRAFLKIQNIIIEETINDMNEMTNNGYHGAIFNVGGEGGKIEITYTTANTTDHLTSFGSNIFGRIIFGQTYHNIHSSSERKSLYMVYAYNGWGLIGNGGVVSHCLTHLGPGVTFQNNPRIKYLDGSTLTETSEGKVGIGTTDPETKLEVNGIVTSKYEGFSYYAVGFELEAHSWSPIVCNNREFNTFGDITYNCQTGVFTTPKAGYYRITAHGFVIPQTTRNDHISVGISISGSLKNQAIGNYFSSVVYLKKNETVTLKSYAIEKSTFGSPSIPNHFFWFQGEYLGK